MSYILGNGNVIGNGNKTQNIINISKSEEKIMEGEKVIRSEAKNFYRSHLRGGTHYFPKDEMQNLKLRLYDFYSSEAKAIFLDEIKTTMIKELVDHRNKAHGGKPKEGCVQEEVAEKMLFYIDQEIGTLPIVAHQRFDTMEAQKRDKIFVSYSHFDKEYLVDIQRHFKPFLNQIELWDDTKIEPGKKWKEEIRRGISSAKVAILLISTDFLGSEFIATDELPPLLEAAEKEGAVILSVILKPCLFEEFSNLNQFQAMNPPSRPVSKMELNEKEELFVNLVRQTKKILFTK